MPGSIILSDDFWLLGPKFARYIETDLKPDVEQVVDVRPEMAAASNLRPQVGTVIPETEAAALRPRTLGAETLRPSSRTMNIKPKMRRVTEE